MMDLSVIIPARNEEFLYNTVEDILKNSRASTEIIVILDGSWPLYPLKGNDKVTLIYHSESIGQRAATNEGVRLSDAKFIMKCDAHCSFEEGFDEKLLSDCEYDWTVIPRMYNLHAFDWVCDCQRIYQGPQPDKCEKCGKDFKKDIIWERRKSRYSDFWRFDNDLHFQYWRAYGKRPEAKPVIADTMSNIGACFLMHRQRYLELDGLDENHGSWGQVGTEISCKTWLSGGRQVVNRNTWFAHMFRTQKGFGFPYHLSGKQVNKAREYSKKLWIGNNWPKAKYKLDWLIEKFSPVPGWDEKNQEIGLVYYTDNHGDKSILEACRTQILRCMSQNNIEERNLVSVSHKALNFGRNIVVDFERSVKSIYAQIIIGLEEVTTDFVYLLEHDLVYHPSHFKYIPEDDGTFYYDRNRWSVCDETGKCVFYHTNVPSMMCANRELLLKHYKKALELVNELGWHGSWGYSPPKGLPKDKRIGRYKTYMAEFPSLDIRRKDAWTRKRMDKSQFRSPRGHRGWTESDSVPGWGKIQDRFNEFIDGLR